MTVQVKDMVFEKVAIGPVSTRVYQGAEYGKGSPIVLFFHGGAFQGSGLQDSAVAESIASAGAIVVVADYNAYVIELTRFVGRHSELDQIQRALSKRKPDTDRS